MPRPTRRRFLQTAGATVAGCLSGCGERPSGPGPFAGQELRVFCYAGGHEATMREVFVPAFEAATGARVTLSPGWWDGIAKLKLAPPDDPPFDLIISDATQGFPAAREGLLLSSTWRKSRTTRNSFRPRSTTGSSKTATASPTRIR